MENEWDEFAGSITQWAGEINWWHSIVLAEDARGQGKAINWFMEEAVSDMTVTKNYSDFYAVKCHKKRNSRNNKVIFIGNIVAARFCEITQAQCSAQGIWRHILPGGFRAAFVQPPAFQCGVHRDRTLCRQERKVQESRETACKEELGSVLSSEDGSSRGQRIYMCFQVDFSHALERNCWC